MARKFKFEKGDRVVVNDKCPKWLNYRGLHGKVMDYAPPPDRTYGVWLDSGDGDYFLTRELDKGAQ